MLQNGSNILLTSTEAAELWIEYMGNSLSKLMFKHFTQTVQDVQVKRVAQLGLQTAQKVEQEVSQILRGDNYPMPTAYTDQELLGKTRLYPDTFCLYYARHMGRLGMPALANCARSDVRAAFRRWLGYADDLHELAAQTLLEKGLYIRPPYIPVPEKTETAEGDVMGGLLGEKRPLFATEVTNLFPNMQTNVLGVNLITGFAQVAQERTLCEYFLRGMEIAKKHIYFFRELIAASDVQSPMTWDANVTLETESPFSDRLMLGHIVSLAGMGLGNYGAAIAASMRTDLVATYLRLGAEIAKYLADGTNLMIERGWLEIPPHAVDRRELALSR